MNTTFFVTNLPDDGDEFVPYEGKVFEAGDYPDKDFSLSEEELEDRALAFAGVDLDLEHSQFRDLLGHRLGRLEKLWRDGRRAIGRLSIPRWLHELSGGKLQTSLTFDRGKNIVGCALTLNPRIADAEVAAAFSAALQFGGAALPSSRDLPDPPDSSRSSPIGAAFDASAVTPISSDEDDFRISPPQPFPPDSLRSLPRGGIFDIFALAHETDQEVAMTQQQGGRRLPISSSNKHKETKTMPTSFKERLRVLFSKAPDAVQEAGIDPAELDYEPSAVDPAIEAQLTEFKATNDRLASGQLTTFATLFADEIIRTAKAVPAQRDHLVALYRGAALADGHGTVRFSDNGQISEGPNMAALRGLFKDAVPHSLFTTQIPNADPNAETDAPDPAMVEKLRSATSLGRQTIKKEAN